MRDIQQNKSTVSELEMLKFLGLDKEINMLTKRVESKDEVEMGNGQVENTRRK